MSDEKTKGEFQNEMEVFQKILGIQKKMLGKDKKDSEKYSFYVRFDELRSSHNWTLLQEKPSHLRIGDFESIEELAKALVKAQKINEK